MEVKNCYIIIIFIVLLVLTFFAGWYFSDRSASKYSAELEERVSNYQIELEEYASRQGATTDALRLAARANSQLTGDIERVAKTNRQLVEGIGNFGIGIEECLESVGRLEEGMDYYISKAKETTRE